MIAEYRDKTEPQSTAVEAAEPTLQSGQLQRLKSAIESAAELLPIPGPITAFAFLNTLHALEAIPFEQGMEQGAQLYRCEPWFSEERYRSLIDGGRIDACDLANVVYDDLKDRANQIVASLCSRFELRMTLLRHSLASGAACELQWQLAESRTFTRFHPDTPAEVRKQLIGEARQRNVAPESNERVGGRTGARRHSEREDLGYWSQPDSQLEAICLEWLWQVCHDRTRASDTSEQSPDTSPRLADLLRKVTGADSDVLVDEMLIRYCATFTDQGMASWALPGKERGFYHAFLDLYQCHGGPPDHWARGLAAEVERLCSCHVEPLESIRESLSMMGYSESEWPQAIEAAMFSLRGWAGLIHQMEVRPDRFARPAQQGTLIEFVAIRLVMERLAIEHLIKHTPHNVRQLNQLRSRLQAAQPQTTADHALERAFIVFRLAQLLNWSPARLTKLSSEQWFELLSEIEQFGPLVRRRIMHRAYERHFQGQALDALWVYSQRATTRVPTPSFQAVFCIDAREESLRRHLEEVDATGETFGAAGFFGVPMYFRGVSDANYTPLCPIIVKPRHWVVEDVLYTLKQAHGRRVRTRRALATATHHVHMGSRGFARGALLTAGLGVLASVPLIARVIFPRPTGRFRAMASTFAQAPPMTRLRLYRMQQTPGPGDGQVGFTIEEMADMVERTLRDIGLTYDFARLVLFVGHGSSSMNNPHKSVYDCGACTGNPGGPNARAIAAMLNDSHVRAILARRGIEIPRDTHFVGMIHNTCEDSVSYFDLESLPESHVEDFEEMQRVFEEACERNSHERCRRFDSAPLDVSFSAAREHVEERSQDLAQARPEFGNASNAMCVVGRRQRTRGLFLDRRSFLMSYDPAQDDANFNILERIVSAVVPVCEGINMQYFMSAIDPGGWGCGTKLPHNITSLVGIMDGASSDLRAGLPWQGVEIHEPMRLLFVIETTPNAMLRIMHRNPTIGRILRNGWAQLAVLSPTSQDIHVFRDGQFISHQPSVTELPEATSSTNWYQGWREHLEFAQITAPTANPETMLVADESCSTTNS